MKYNKPANEYTYLEHMSLFSVTGTNYVVIADSKEDASMICYINSVPCQRKKLNEIKCLSYDATLLEGDETDLNNFRNNIDYRICKQTFIKKGTYRVNNA